MLLWNCGGVSVIFLLSEYVMYLYLRYKKIMKGKNKLEQLTLIDGIDVHTVSKGSCSKRVNSSTIVIGGVVILYIYSYSTLIS